MRKIFIVLICSLLAGECFAAVNVMLSDELRERLDAAGDNMSELLGAYERLGEEYLEGFGYLVINMPERDLRSLKGELLVNNIEFAYKVVEEVPWGKEIPREIFLDNILPYANVTERRDDWRGRFYKEFMPLVKDCKTISEAAETLNSTIFGKYGIVYSTKRPRTDMSPFEMIEYKMATCTGLSIMLVDACRAVGVPARVAGIPNWVDKSGNHTWVEVWDDGWHFTGAAEPAKLDNAWFSGKAAKALKGSLMHAIYGVSFKRTGKYFPLSWARGVKYVNAVDNTDMYAWKDAKISDEPVVAVRVWDREGGQRVEAGLKVYGAGGEVLFEGTTKGSQADMNDSVSFALPESLGFKIEISYGNKQIRRQFADFDGQRKVIDVYLNGTGKKGNWSLLETEGGKELDRKLELWFGAADAERGEIQFSKEEDELLQKHEQDVRGMAWEAYSRGRLAKTLKSDYENFEVKNDDYVSPYLVKQIGEKPASGWPLFIAMHGGGQTAKEFNDRQWRSMRDFYHDQMDAGGYIYVSLRAPTDEWNGFYTGYIYPLIGNLIRQFMIYEEVNSNKIYALGYSHGGYGAFAIGPTMADRFAAVHSSAVAPTGGQSAAFNLRNMRFTYMIGEKDTAYNRLGYCVDFNKTIEGLKGGRDDIYPVFLELKKGIGHGGLPDRDKIAEMIEYTRNPLPKTVCWEMTVGNVSNFYWLRIPNGGSPKKITADIHDNTIVLNTENVEQVHLLLDDRVVNVEEPVKVKVNGSVTTAEIRPEVQTLVETLLERGDSEFAFTSQIKIEIE